MLVAETPRDRVSLIVMTTPADIRTNANIEIMGTTHFADNLSCYLECCDKELFP